MKLISITNTETSVLSLWIHKALVEGENEEMVLVVFGSELMDQITTILLQEGVSVIEEKSLQSEFKGGRRSKVNTSQSPPEPLLSLKKFHSPNIRLTAAVISKNYSLNNLSQLPELKKQVLEPLLSLLSSTSKVTVINSSETMALGTIVMLAVTHPHVQYTAECTTPLSIFQPKEGEFEVVFAGHGDSVSSTLTGKALEAKIQEMLTSVPTITSFSEASLFFLRKIIFAIIKERDHKRSIQTFQNDIITQLTDSTQTKEDGFDRKRKYEQVSESGELENTRKVGKIRSVKSLPSVEDGLSVFEFFSGIGGMRLALPKEIRGIPIKHITAFDINRIANQFYQYNFHERKIDGIQDSQLKTCVIEALKAEDVDGKCDIWTMSPPCQPFTTTRGANRKDHLDNRSKGLYHIMLLLLTIQKLPRWIVLENVKGFVNSEMYTLWLQVIRSCGYEFEEYLLSPETAVGIPNARKRYYFIAELKDSTTVDSLDNRDSSVLSNNQLLDELGHEDRPDTEDDAGKTSNAMKDDEEMIENDVNHEDEEEVEESGEAGLKSEAVPTTFTSSTVYLNENVKTQLPLDVQRLFSLSKNPSSSNEAITLRKIIQRRINENDWLRFNTMPELIVPLNILQASWAKKHLSIADLDSQLTYCFTKGYGKIYDHSAGSCLFIPSLTSQSTAKEIDRAQLTNYHQMIRLFHPEELLVLFGFPNDYSFPSITSSLTLSHQYGCIGNSVNVTVVKAVMHRLFQ